MTIIDGVFDVIKILIGAGIALFSAYLIKQGQREEDQIAAGNLAMMTIAVMLSAFHSYRVAWTKNQDAVASAAPKTPRWLQHQPMYVQLDKSLKLDFPSLAFLFGKRTAVVMNAVFEAQMAYDYLASMHELHYADMNSVQDRIGELQLQAGEHEKDIDFNFIEANIPPHLRLRIEGTSQAIATIFLTQEPKLIDAAGALRKALASVVGDDRIVRLTMPTGS